MLIGLTGMIGSGKDAVGQYLVSEYGLKRMAFADAVKRLCEEINPDCKNMVKKFGWDNTKKLPRFRELQQTIGQGARLAFGDNFWIDMVMNNLEGNTVITDVRYENEFARVKEEGGYLIRIFRPESKIANNHITEVGHLSLPVDYTIVNDGSLDDLYAKTDRAMIDLGWLQVLNGKASS